MSNGQGTAGVADRVSAAACAAWWTLLVGFVLVTMTGIVYMFIVHTPLIEAVSALWGTAPKVVSVIFIAFITLLKMFLTLWLLGCVFLTVWARRLRGTVCA